MVYQPLPQTQSLLSGPPGGGPVLQHAAIAVPLSEPPASANQATTSAAPSRARAAPTAAAWLGPPRPD